MEASESLYHYVSRHSGFAALSSCLLFVGTLVYSVGLNTNKSSTIWFSHMRRAERHGAFTLRRSRPLPSSTDDGRTLFQTAFALHGVSKVHWVFDYCTKSSTYSTQCTALYCKKRCNAARNAVRSADDSTLIDHVLNKLSYVTVC